LRKRPLGGQAAGDLVGGRGRRRRVEDQPGQRRIGQLAGRQVQGLARRVPELAQRRHQAADHRRDLGIVVAAGRARDQRLHRRSGADRLLPQHRDELTDPQRPVDEPA
jgi:hypothetical protein